MHLKSLTLRGFKSFAAATTLNFEPGITCVVGPNGSGKSNVVDALSWVMGEQGAKSLRGGKMEDVIFAGTSGRAPLGRAEVVLTIDNTDGALPIDYAEVTIARTMFRNGGSEYAINGNTARLLDVQELLSDSGIGREMHVIVGQGQLDTILQATPEVRRGFVEEAAGVLKHRKRKEKALRKLEACEGNLNRLSDLIGEIRRQLKPLGRQADVARKAAVIQAELRDAKARLLADDILQATLARESDVADEQALLERRRTLEAALDRARVQETEAEEAVRAGVPRLTAAQETWYSLAALRERVATTLTIAGERVRNAEDEVGEIRHGRDPEELDREAAKVAAEEAELSAEAGRRADALEAASEVRERIESEHRTEEGRLAAQIRAAADRREGLARLTGQVNSLRSRAEAADAEIGRLTAASQQAELRADHASRAFTALETTVAGLEGGESGLDSDHEIAADKLEAVEAELAELREQESTAAQERAALNARVDALQVGLNRKDASSALLTAAEHLDGVLGSVAALIEVQTGYETAVASALGAASEAVAVDGLDAAVGAFDHLKHEDLGRAELVLAGPGRTERGMRAEPVGGRPAGRDAAELPSDLGARWLIDVVGCDPQIEPAVHRLLRDTVAVPDLAAARALLAAAPELTAVTRDGDVLGAYVAAGGSSAQPSLIEVQAAIDEATAKLEAATHTYERLRFAQTELSSRREAAEEAVETTLSRLHESDAAMAAVAEELGQLSASARSAHGEAERLRQSITAAEEARDSDLAGLADLEFRLERASDTDDEPEPDPARRDQLAEDARLARAAEMDARLALRTMEERVRALAGRADALRRAAENERQTPGQGDRAAGAAAPRGGRGPRRAAGGTGAGERVEASIALAGSERAEADAARTEAEAALGAARKTVRGYAADFEALVDTAHRDEMARTEHRMRIEALEEKAMAELGLEPESLLGDYGPEQLVPVLTRADGSALGRGRRAAGAAAVRP